MVRTGIILVSTILAVSLTHLSAQQATFRAGTELVSLTATVSDRKGQFLTDLTRDDFEVLEDGKPQTLQQFAHGDDLESGPDLHIGLLFDTSGSMDADIKMSRSAAIKFLNTMNYARDMTLVDFDTEVRVTKFSQQDFPRLVERIRSRKPEGFTAMYDALGVYLDGATDLMGRKILVVFTDGGDTRSAIRFGDAMTLIRASDVMVYAIGFLDNQSSGSRSDQRLRLTQMATESGGSAFFPSTMKEIEEAYDIIVSQVRSQYTLGYVSTNTATDGRWRKVEIRVRPPAANGTRIQSRKGYFAPYRTEPTSK
jgi:Ca-activated chloride channel family protein